MSSSILNLINFTLICIAGMYLLTRSRRVVNLLLEEKKTAKNVLFCIFLFAFPIILTSKFGLPIMGVTTNLRTSIVFFSAVVGGPLCGLAVAIIGFLYRLTLGGWTGFACAAATLAGGITASLLVSKTNIYPGRLTWKAMGIWTLLVLIWEHIHILIFIPVLCGQPFSETFSLLLNWIYFPQIIANTFTMFILCFLMMDLVTLDTRILSEKQKKWLQKTLTFAYELENKVEERTKELADANKKLYDSSIRDPLTSLYNRLYLQQIILDENTKLAQGSYRSYSVLCIDLDNFKHYNDRYGHLAGDIILREFANTLKSQIQNVGIIFRTGGDEFTVLLPDVDTGKAVLLAQKIISELETANSFKQKVESGLMEEINEQAILSCSIGIKTLVVSTEANSARNIERAECSAGDITEGSVPFLGDDAKLDSGLSTSAGKDAEDDPNLINLNKLLYLADKRLLHAKLMGKNQYSIS